MSESVFNSILVKLKKEAPDPWSLALLSKCAYSGSSDEFFEISVPGSMHLKFFREKFEKRINELIAENFSDKVKVKFKLDDNLAKQFEMFENSEEESEEVKIDYNMLRERAKLVENYNFSNFVIGVNNEYAAALAKRVVEVPGSEINPLFIYGGVGLGKTHIQMALGNAMLERYPKKRILYVNGYNFQQEFVNSLTNGPKYGKNMRVNKFADKYKNLDVFLLDDIQQLSKSIETSKKLFEIYHEMERRGGQMVFVADRPPRSLKNFADRLRSRFEKSHIAEIEAPKMETRAAIIKMLVQERHKRDLPEEIIYYIAENVTSDIRRLDGAIRTYLFKCDVYGLPLDVKRCEERAVLKDYLTRSSIKHATIKDIISAVAKFYDISIKDLTGKRRNKFISHARHIAMFLANELTDKSKTEIGIEFNRDHSTVISGYNKIYKLIEDNPYIKDEIDKVKDMLGSAE